MTRAPDAVMLFAAGLGTRMMPLTADRPKPLIEVAGRTLLDHALEQTEGAGIALKVINAHYRAGQIATAAAARGLVLSDETAEVLETGGGLKHALPLFGAREAVFTLNTDAVWTGPRALATLAAAWDPARMDGLLLLCPPERAAGHALRSGFAMDADGRLRWQPDLAYTGAQILKLADVADDPQRVFSLRDTWDRMLARGRLCGVIHPGHWADVGRPEGIATAEVMLADV